VTLAAGFPKLMQSEQVPGLNPGFHIVVLGFCPAEHARPALALAKAFFPQAYERTVTAPADSCPTAASSGYSVQASESIAAEDLRLTVSVYTPDEAHKRSDLFGLILLFRDNELVEVKKEGLGPREGEPGEGTTEQNQAVVTVMKNKKGIVLERQQSHVIWGNPGSPVEPYGTTRTTCTIDQGKIRTTSKFTKAQ
jgi:hypothetical protein